MKFREDGFTLLEIIIALGIIAVLTSLAISLFSNERSRANIKGTTLTMMQDAQFLERWKSFNGTYAREDGKCPDFPYKFFPEKYAAYSIDSAKSMCDDSRYIIRAIPICGMSERDGGNYSCLCLVSGDSINESANSECINGKSTCKCIDI